MSIVRTNGVVWRDKDQTEKQAASVDRIEFLSVQQRGVQVGDRGDMYLHAPPPGNEIYNLRDVLRYKGTNQNENSMFEVKSNIGPTKYDVIVRRIGV